MGARISLGELVRTFGSTYRAIDFRCAATREGESWTNALAVIRLTYETPGAARERLKAVEQHYGRVETDHFRIFTEIRPFSDWEELARGIGIGVLYTENIEIRLRQPVALEDLASDPRYYHYRPRPFDGQQWPGVYVTMGTVESTRLSGEHLFREVGALGYSNLGDVYFAEIVDRLRTSQMSGGSSGFAGSPRWSLASTKAFWRVKRK